MNDFLLVARIILMSISGLVLFGLGLALIRRRIGKNFFAVMTIFWTSVFLISLDPSLLDLILNNIGLDNRAQFLLIMSFGIILYMLLQQTTKNKNTSINLYNVVRDVAIKSFKKEYHVQSDVVIIIVAKNEAQSIQNVCDKIKSVMKNLSYKIIVVNDGSTDNTATIAREQGALVVDHLFNLGIGGATKTGYIASSLLKPKFIISVDADGQHDPKYIPQIMATLDEGADLVYGSRFSKEADYKTTRVRSVGNKFYTFLVNKLAKTSITDVNTGYRGIRAEAVKNIYFNSETNFAIELAIRAGRNKLRISEIPIQSQERKQGHSQFHKIDKFILYNINAIKQIFNAFFKNAEKNYILANP